MVSVELLDNTTVECTLSSHSLGQECLNNVCQRLGLLQPQYFGLRFMSKKGTSWWVDLGRPLKKQLDKYAQENCSLYLGVMYFVSDVHLLHDEVTRYHYFLQLKSDIIEGKLQCSEEQIILFASYSLQAEFGDHDPERHTTEYLTNFGLLPKNMSAGKRNQEAVLEQVISTHRNLQGLSQQLAEVYYIMEAQHLDGYGQECFAGKDSCGTTILVGVSLIGIFITYMNEEPPLYFQWDHIINLVHHKRCFGIEHRSNNKVLQVFLEDSHLAKYVWKTCIRQHRFYTRNERLPSYRGNTSIAQSSQNKQEFLENRTHLQESQESLDGLAVYNTEGGYSECVSPGTTYGPVIMDGERMSELPCPAATDLFQQRVSPSLVAPSSQTLHLGSSQPLSHSSLYSSSGHLSQVDISTYHQQNVSRQQFECKDNSSIDIRCMVLPVYRQAPDYETAVRLKYGIQSHSTGDIVPSSPLIQSHNTVSSVSHCDIPQAYPGQSVAQHQSYSHYKNYSDLSRLDLHDPPREKVAADPMSTRNFEPVPSSSNPPAHTYSSPELASQVVPDDRNPTEKKLTDVQILYQFKPPPPYPYKTRPSSSTPDLTKSYLQTQQTNSSPELVSHKNVNMISKFTNQQSEGPDAGNHFYHHVHDANDNVSKAMSTSGADYLQNCALSATISTVHVDSSDCSKYAANVVGTLQSKSPLQKATPSQNHGTTQGYPNHNCNTMQVGMAERTNFTEEAPIPVSAIRRTEKPSLHYVSSASESTQLQGIPLSSLLPSDSHVENKECPSASMTNLNNLQINKTVNLSTQEVDSRCMGPMLVAAMNGLVLSRPDVISPPGDGKKFPKDSRIQALESKLEEGQVFLEFERIIKKKPLADFSTAVLPENMSGNRFKDVFPYEENRVHLTPTKENRTGYINASHITVTIDGTPRSYIGAQGPLPNTLYSFWQMIWEHHVCVVVMLTEVQEQGKDKCFRYWPQEESSKVQIGEFQIVRNFSMSSPTYITCSLTLCHLISRHQRTVWHIQYTDWPDHSCPQDVQGFINFMGEIDAVRRHASSHQSSAVLHTPPVVVHCSAGVGRSGVVILCDIMLYALDHNQSIDIPEVLTQLRLQRMLTVQTLAQYKFVYSVLIQYLKNSRLI